MVPAVERDLTATKPQTTSRARSLWTSLGLAVVLLAGLTLRLIYLLRASPFVDEYSTLLAVQGIIRRGAPFLPTGFFYGHDPLYSYAATGAAVLWPDDLVAVRVLSLLASVGAIGLTYWIGKSLFSTRAGLLAAAFLALSPGAVLWGARGRAYALELLLTLIAFWLFYQGVAEQRPRWRRLGLLVLVAAVFTHPEAALLLPGLAVAVLVLRGFRWWLHLDRLLEFALASAGVLSRYLLQNALAHGDLGGFDTIANARPALGLFTNWVGGLETLGRFLFSGPSIPATILALLAILIWGLRPRGDSRSFAVRFLAITLVTILLQMAFVIGGTWQSTRYLLFALPFLFLLAGAGLEVLALWLTPRLPRAAATALLAVIVAVALWPAVPAAVRAANTSEIAYDLAFDYVQEQWSAGDRIATLAPAAAWIAMGRVDYFTLGETYEEFVWQKDGQWYDRWVGAPLIRTASELDAALDEVEAAGVTLWLITDEARLPRRFAHDMIQTVWDRMSLVHAEGRAQLFRSEPTRLYALEVDSPRRETFGGQIALGSYAIGEPTQAGAPPNGAIVVEPGQSLPMRLDLQALSPLTNTYTLFVHLVGPDGTGYAQGDGLPLGGLYPMHLWQPGIRYPDLRTLDLPPEIGPGRYRLEAGFYDFATGDRLSVTDGPGQLPGDALLLDYVTVLDEERPGVPAVPLDAELGDAIRLLGFTSEPPTGTIQPGQKLALTLHWQAVAPTDEAYTLFVHVVGPDGATLTQHDGQPLGGFYPTAFWDPGEQGEEQIVLSIPDDAAPGSYEVVAGFYLLGTGTRLPVTGADAGPGDAVQLTTIQVAR
jgi:hypothetical protein